MERWADKYHSFLCSDYPEFIDRFVDSGILSRLSYVGLLCGTDWTPLFNNRFYYSRLDHSVGAALIVWNFTHDKRQTLAGLFHDVATPAFSHVIDFRNGDALKQESTESLTHDMINNDVEVSELLFMEGIYKYEIDDYHRYPVCDNDMPGLSADRLEYMYPSGAALSGEWSLDEIRENYSNIVLCKNEKGLDELGFSDDMHALVYAKKFCNISLILQKNEDKVAMQLMADVVARAIECGFICEDDLYSLSEAYIIGQFDRLCRLKADEQFCRLYGTYRKMKEVLRSEIPMDGCYNISVDVKKRYVDPLVKVSGSRFERLSKISREADEYIKDFLRFEDSRYACVRFVDSL